MSTRRLAAVMFTDIVGYTSMMQENEQLALEKLQQYKSCLEQEVAKHQGEIIQYYGDGCLLVFPSAVLAVQCAQAMQLSFQQQYELPVRIGIHMGDILQKEGNIYGDAVNVASRVESMGVPGSVLFSHNIRASIKNQTDLPATSLGSFRFKNVREDLEVFALITPGLQLPQAGKLKGKFTTPPKVVSRPWVWVVGIVLALGIGLGGWVLRNRHQASSQEDTYTRLLVLPFDVQGSSEIQYLGRGMVDLLSTKLDGVGPIRTLDPNMVFSVLEEQSGTIRNPEFAIKSFQDHQPERIVLGNVVQLGKQLRFNASLYDASAQLVDRVEVVTENEADLPLLIDELARKLISHEFQTEGMESEGMAALSTSSIEALQFYLKGETYRRNGQFREAFRAYTKATELDPGFALAWRAISNIQAWGYFQRNQRHVYAMVDSLEFKLPPKLQLVRRGWDAFYRFDFDRLERIYRQGIKEYGEDVEFLRLYGEYLFHSNMHNLKKTSEARPYFEKALEYQPDNQELQVHLVQLYAMEGNARAVDSLAELANPLSVNWPSIRVLQLLARDSLANQGAMKEIIAHRNFSLRRIWNEATNAWNLPQMDILVSNMIAIIREKDPVTADAQQLIIDASRGRVDKEFGGVPYRSLAVRIQSYMGEPNFTTFADHYEGLRESLLRQKDQLRRYDKVGLNIYNILLGDEVAYRAQMKEFEALRGREDEVGPVQWVLYICQAYWARNLGDNESALAHLDSALKQQVPPNVSIDYDMSMGNLHLMKAEILFEQEDYSEALDWYRSLLEFRGMSSLFTGMVCYRLAKCLEAIGKEQESLPYYDYFLELYQESDPRFQNWLADAQNAQQRLRLGE